MAGINDILMLHVTEHAAQLANVSARGNNVSIDRPIVVAVKEHRPDVLAIDDETVRAALTDAIRDAGWRGRSVWCLVGGTPVACQHFEMPAMKPAALHSAVALKLGQQLHYDVRQAILWMSPTIDGSRGGWIDAVAIRGDVSRHVAAICTQIGLCPVRLSAAPSALAGLGAAISAVNGTGLEALLNASEFAPTLILYRDGRVFATTDLTVGLSDLTNALRRPIIKGEDVIQLDAAAARKLRDEVGLPSPGRSIESLGIPSDRILPLLEPVVQQLTKQLTQWLSFARGSAGGVSIQSLRIVGPGAALKGFSETLAARLHIDVQSLSKLDGHCEIRGGECDPNDFTVMAGAALTNDALPELLPAEIRRGHHIERWRRFSIWSSALVSAAMIALTFLLRQVTGGLAIAHATESAVLQKTTTELTYWNGWHAREAETAAIERALSGFTRETPRWNGLFKELSSILPAPVRISRLECRNNNDRLAVRMTASLYEVGTRSSFNRLVEQTLGVLQSSPFFQRVEVLSAARSKETTDHRMGTMSVDLVLAYRRETPAPGVKPK